MPHHTPLIATIVAGIGIAFLLGALANRLRLSPLVGYLVAGIVVGPFTPGYVADQKLAAELAEIGVVLLMFGVGLHFSLKDLLNVKRVTIPGALGQIAIATMLGLLLSLAMGWGVVAGLVFGLALSVASTVVLLRALEERRMMQTERGRIAVGWLIVEDLVMVLALVLLPALAHAFGSAGTDAGLGARAWNVLLALAFTVGKVALFIALMLLVGQRLIPWLLHRVSLSGSRELFRVAVLAIALGVAFGAAMLFDVSFALGAFFAGMVLSESELSHQAANETLPLRDAFAVLFFVSVGMLFDPMILLEQPLAVLATLLIIIVGKSAAAFIIVRAFRLSRGTAFTISASLAQIGEFSFILAGVGIALNLMPSAARDLILAGAILSILINPLLFVILDRMRARSRPQPVVQVSSEDDDPPVTALKDHAVIIGFGRVGSVIAEALRKDGTGMLAIEERRDYVESARLFGIEVILGDAQTPKVLAAANIAGARHLFVAIPNGFDAGQIVVQAKALNPELEIVARAHSDAEIEHLRECGAHAIVMGEREIALAMYDQMASGRARARARAAADMNRPSAPH
ncbi:MAG: Kef family K(+) transporter [Alphaproteobacteria bacterium]|nr:Kef family K(+) transporter [Alphaproteobacteria bacterium]MCW5744543.1 Kef family K(+) transporter [Alphaproteobacteria bacterium]